MWHRHHQNARLCRLTQCRAAGSPEGIETEALEHGGWAGRSSEAARGAAAAVAWSWLVLLRCRTCPDCHSASAGRREGLDHYGAGHYGGGGGSASRNVRARLYLLPTTVDSYQSELTVNAAVQTVKDDGQSAHEGCLCFSITEATGQCQSERVPKQGYHIQRNDHDIVLPTTATHCYWVDKLFSLEICGEVRSGKGWELLTRTQQHFQIGNKYNFNQS